MKIEINVDELSFEQIVTLIKVGIIKGSVVDPSDPRADEVIKGHAKSDPKYLTYISPNI
jgi:hypothetical protein